jgi:hypothetical protein
MGLTDVVEIMPYMMHRDCVRNMVDSDVLLLIEGGRGSEAFHTGKLFEYIQAGRPILALVPENGAAAGLIRETRTGTVCRWSDIGCIEQALLGLYNAWRRDGIEYDPDRREIAKYDRRLLTEKLARILDDAIRSPNNLNS